MPIVWMRKESIPQNADEAIDKRHQATIRKATILGTIVSTAVMCGPILGGLVWIGRGSVIEMLALALAPSVRAQVTRQISPLSDGLKALIENNISTLEEEIAELERQDRVKPLSELDTQRLVKKRRDLRNQREALAKIMGAEARQEGA